MKIKFKTVVLFSTVEILFKHKRCVKA
uniref:Uncharacterized protein n=1 Tax=Ciona intestinalis TaxID=7719 RepID=H2Y046_CIOIN